MANLVVPETTSGTHSLGLDDLRWAEVQEKYATQVPGVLGRSALSLLRDDVDRLSMPTPHKTSRERCQSAYMYAFGQRPLFGMCVDERPWPDTSIPAVRLRAYCASHHGHFPAHRPAHDAVINARTSRSMTESFRQHLSRHLAIASSADRPGRRRQCAWRHMLILFGDAWVSDGVPRAAAVVRAAAEAAQKEFRWTSRARFLRRLAHLSMSRSPRSLVTCGRGCMTHRSRALMFG